MTNCSFCEEIACGINGSSVAHLFKGKLASRTIYESENFIVLPTLGSFVRGYLLIISRSHFISVAQLPQPLRQELVELKKKFIDILRRAFEREVLTFEHGSSTLLDRGGQCVTHLHLNLVPTGFDIESLLDRYFSRKRVIENYDELTSNLFVHSPYVLYEWNNRVITYDSRFTPSQFVRQLIAKKAGIYEWDWRSCTFLDNLTETYYKLTKVIAETIDAA